MDVIEKKREMTGDFEVLKYPANASGSAEVVYKDHNVITSGMAAGLSRLFGGVGSQRITDYAVDRFQAGTGGTAELAVSGTRALGGDGSTSLTGAQYGSETNLEIRNHYYYDSNDANNQSDSKKAFAIIPKTRRTMIGDHSVRYTLVLDENTANSMSLDEIGLFMKNPAGFAENTSILVAYKYFTAITKTSAFGLIFRWTLNL